MGWKIKNFNILGVHGKIRVSGGGGHEKLIFRGELPKKRGLGQFADLRGDWQEGGGWCFWGVGGERYTPLHTMKSWLWK